MTAHFPRLLLTYSELALNTNGNGICSKYGYLMFELSSHQLHCFTRIKQYLSPIEHGAMDLTPSPSREDGGIIIVDLKSYTYNTVELNFL